MICLPEVAKPNIEASPKLKTKINRKGTVQVHFCNRADVQKGQLNRSILEITMTDIQTLTKPRHHISQTEDSKEPRKPKLGHVKNLYNVYYTY